MVAELAALSTGSPPTVLRPMSVRPSSRTSPSILTREGVGAGAAGEKSVLYARSRSAPLASVAQRRTTARALVYHDLTLWAAQE
jgi:hypothetical protein